MKAKSLKKSSDEDKSRLKKSKSKKRKRHYSSDSADNSRKKLRKSKELKKKRKKKPRRVSTPATSSSHSSDYSVSSGSTCEKRKPNRSRSPVSRGGDKSKLRKERNGAISKFKGRERGRSHKRSRSCSTCSSSRSSTCSESSRSTSRNRSPNKSKKVRKDRAKAEKEQVLRHVDSDVEERDKVIPACDEIVPSSKDEENKMQRGTNENKPVAELSDKVVSEKTPNDGTKKTGVVDAELILRQKALENFIKFHKVKKCGLSEEKKIEPVDEPKKVGLVPDAMVADKIRGDPTLDDPTIVTSGMASNGKGEIISDIQSRRPKLRSVIIIPTHMKVSEDNTAMDTYNSGEISGHINEAPNHDEDEQEKVPEQNINPYPNLSSSIAPGLRKDEVQHETTSGVETGGAQFEKKSFSRMHEGETVQVSYKVYIPKKAPALARRKLQRGETSTS